jgi:hypothetical protein
LRTKTHNDRKEIKEKIKTGEKVRIGLSPQGVVLMLGEEFQE